MRSLISIALSLGLLTGGAIANDLSDTGESALIAAAIEAVAEQEAPKDPPAEAPALLPDDGSGPQTNSLGGPGGPGGGTPAAPDIGDPTKEILSADVDILDERMFGDFIDIDTGGLSFTHTDVSLPGNSALPVQFTRTLERKRRTSRNVPGLGNWDLAIPYITQPVAYGRRYVLVGSELQAENYAGPQQDRCSGEAGGPYSVQDVLETGNAIVYRHQFWSGPSLVLEGGASVQLFLNTTNPGYSPVRTPNVEYSPYTPRYVSKDGWRIECDVTNIPGGHGEGYKAISPAGTTYTFDIWSTAGGHAQNKVSIGHEVLYASRVEDIHGNWVEYEFNGDKLSRIIANDGREITVTWTGDKITSVTANGRTWTYQYTGSPSYLQYVNLPDGTRWELDWLETPQKWEENNPHDICPTDTYKNFVIKHPVGSQATYEFDVISNGRAWIIHHQPADVGTPEGFFDPGCYPEGGAPGHPKSFLSIAVDKKTIAVPDAGTYVWDRDYEEDTGRYQSLNTYPGYFNGLSTKWRTVTYPDGRVVKTYVNRDFTVLEGTVEKVETYASAGGALLETVETEYTHGHAFYAFTLGDPRKQSAGAPLMRYETKKTITRGSDVYVTEYAYQMDPAAADYAFGKPHTVTRTSNVSSGSRVTTFTYEHKKTPWVLGLPKKVTREGKEYEEHFYNALGQRTSTETFNTVTSTYAYHTTGDQKGALHTATDALGRVTTYTNYKRGAPQNITYATGSADQIAVSRVVDNNGWTTSATNARGFTTLYNYDDMGRLTLIDPHAGWTNTVITYSSLGNGLVKTAAKGSHTTVTTYDGMLRPVLEKKQANWDGGGSIYTKTEYDGLGRTTFVSWPSASSNPTAGVATAYDALDRVLTESETVTPYATTSYDYLSDNRTEITDPSGAQTTTTFDAWGAPSTDEPVLIQDAEGGQVQLTRNVYGLITNLAQSGNTNGYAVAVNRLFWYDARNRLCRHRAPEIGDELFAYDAADRLTQSARGLAAASGCATPPTGDAITYVYDDLDRQTGIDFPDATPDIAKTYDANGNLTTVSRTGSSWTYGYTPLDQLSSETLVVDGRTYALSYGYHLNGRLNTQTLPNGELVEFDPDGYGRPRRLRVAGVDHVSNISYHPNGLIAAASYANGQAFTQTLSIRQAPHLRIATKAGVATALSLEYGYDVRGKVASIDDHAVAGNDRTFLYDGKGRLESVGGDWGAFAFVYDALDNIRQKTLGARVVDIQYWSQNRVTRMRDSFDGGAWRYYGYDTRGNTTDTDKLTFTYDFANQPTAVTGTGVSQAHTYDGNLKRVKTVENGETTYSVYSSLTGGVVYRDNATTSEETAYLSAGAVSVRFKGSDPAVYTHKDHLGSPVAATDTAGAVLWREQYNPLGEKRLDPAGNRDNEGYTGHVSDSATGLIYMQARYMDPVTGRFLTTDPIGYQDQLNLYAYVHNDPVNGWDPDGQKKLTVGLTGRAALGNVGAKVGVQASFDTKRLTASVKISGGRRVGSAAKLSLRGEITNSSEDPKSDVKVTGVADVTADAGVATGSIESTLEFSARDGLDASGVKPSATGAVGVEAVFEGTKGEGLGGAVNLGVGVDAGVTGSVEISVSLTETAEAFGNLANAAADTVNKAIENRYMDK